MLSLVLRLVLIAIMAPVVMVAMAVLAVAQDDTVVRVSPLINEYWDLIVVAIMGVVGIITAYFWKLVGKLLGEQVANQIRGYLNPVIENAAARALANIKDAHLTNVNIDVKNKVVADAANYAIAAVPDALRFFGFKLDPNDPALRKRIEAEIAKIMLKVNPQETLAAEGTKVT